MKLNIQVATTSDQWRHLRPSRRACRSARPQRRRSTCPARHGGHRTCAHVHAHGFDEKAINDSCVCNRRSASPSTPAVRTRDGGRDYAAAAAAYAAQRGRGLPPSPPPQPPTEAPADPRQVPFIASLGVRALRETNGLIVWPYRNLHDRWQVGRQLAVQQMLSRSSRAAAASKRLEAEKASMLKARQVCALRHYGHRLVLLEVCVFFGPAGRGCSKSL